MRSRSALAVFALAGCAVLISGATAALGSVPRAPRSDSVVRAGEPQRIDPVRGEPTALSCPTADFCAAVVHDEDGPARLVSYNDGQSTFTPTQFQRIKTVACGTAQFCVAGPPDAAYIWDGNDWSGPQTLGPDLAHGPVCAPGTTTCVYVGGGTSVVHDGSGWHTVQLPSGFDDTFAVSCATATFCEALDIIEPEPGYYPSEERAAHFDGTSWHRDADPHGDFEHGSSGLIPDEISCATPTYCLAVSQAGGRVQSFDGTSWTKLDERRVHKAGDMSGLTCVAPGMCFGTKSVITARWQYPFRPVQGLVAYRDGEWSLALQGNVGRIPAPSCVLELQCYAIDRPHVLSCPSAALCRVVDVQGDIYSIEDGQWAAVDHLVATQGTLSDVSCASRKWCMAIDRYGNALRWSHGQWSAPVKIDGNEVLTEISCSASRVCVAIDADHGKNADTVRSGGRAIRYSSGRWHAPQVVDTRGRLQGVSCSTARRCVIVDSNGRVIVRKTGGWRAPEAIAHSLAGISCVGKSFCLATGAAPRISVFVEGRWKAGPQPPVALPGPVDCLDRHFCLVDGAYVLDSHGWRPTHAAVSPNRGPGYTSISCGSRRFCVVDADLSAEDVYYLHPAYVVRRTHTRRLPNQATHVSCVGNMCMQVRRSVAFVLTDG